MKWVNKLRSKIKITHNETHLFQNINIIAYFKIIIEQKMVFLSEK